MAQEKQATDDKKFMKAAIAEAVKAAAKGEIPVGAVVVMDGKIIARAHNLRESGKNALLHAECEAIRKACKKLSGWRLWRCDLYVTLEPCPMCAGAIINSRIKRLVYGAADAKAGAAGSVTDLFSMPFNHSPEVTRGVMAKESAALLGEFFKKLRAEREKTKNK